MVALHVCQVWWTLAYELWPTNPWERGVINLGAHSAKVEVCARASIRLACFAGTCQILVLFVTLRLCTEHRACVRGVYSSNTHCVAVYRPISTAFRGFFFTSYCSFPHDTQFSYSLLGGATIVAKLRSKIAKSPKIGGKDFPHHFV